MKRLFLFLIKVYQKTLSLDHGPMKKYYPFGYCRFSPTCSEYSYEAIDKYGVLRGGFMAIRRILRCQPCSKGGHDPVVCNNETTMSKINKLLTFFLILLLGASIYFSLQNDSEEVDSSSMWEISALGFTIQPESTELVDRFGVELLAGAQTKRAVIHLNDTAANLFVFEARGITEIVCDTNESNTSLSSLGGIDACLIEKDPDRWTDGPTGPLSSEEERIQYQIINGEYIYTLVFYGDKMIEEDEQIIVDSFKFIGAE